MPIAFPFRAGAASPFAKTDGRRWSMSQHNEPTGLVPEDRTGTMTGLKWMPAWVRGELPSPPMAGC